MKVKNMKDLKEEIENLETTETTTVVNQPTGAAKEESKTLWDRFMEATKEPDDAPLFGAKEQPVPDDVKEPKAELKEDWNVNEDKPDAEQFEAYVLIQKSGITNMYDTRFVSEVARDVLDVDLTRFNCMYIFKHYEELMNEYADEIDVSDSKVRTFMNWYSDIYGEDEDDEEIEFDESLKNKSNKLTLDENLFKKIRLGESFVTEWWGQVDEDPYEFADNYNLECERIKDNYDSTLYKFSGSKEDILSAMHDGYFYSVDLGEDEGHSEDLNESLNEAQLDIEHNPKDRAEATLMSLGTCMKKASSLRASLVKEYQYNLDDDSKLNRIADFASLLDAAIQGALDEIDKVKAQGEQKDDEAEVANESLDGEVEDESLKEEIQWQNYQERCADCIALVEKDGRWFCDEAQDFCENVIDCPEGLGELVESCCGKSSKSLKEEDDEVSSDDDVEIPDEVVEDAIDEIKDAFSNSEITSEEAIDKIFDCIGDNEFKLELASDVVKAVEEESEEELSEDLVYGQATLDDYLDVIKKYYRNRDVEDVIDSIFKMFPDNKAAMDLASSVGEVIEEYAEDEEY